MCGQLKCKKATCLPGSTRTNSRSKRSGWPSLSRAVRRLSVQVATVGNWKCHRATGAAAHEVASSAAAVTTRRPVSEVEAENSRLRRELADAKLDVEVLRKATSYFGKESREVRLDRSASRSVHRQPAVPGALGRAQWVLIQTTWR